MLVKTEVVRLRSLERLRKNPKLIKKIFTKKELKYALGKRFPDQPLAARLAAKNAFLAVLGKKNVRSVAPTDIEIINDRYGKPHLNWRGMARVAAKKLGVCGSAVSLTHAENYAAASVFIQFARPA